MTPREATETIIAKLEADAADAWYPRTFYDDAAEAIEQSITATVEAERDACAKIAYAQYASIQETAPSGRHPGQGKRECCADRCIEIRDRIRARSNGGTE